MVFSMTLCDMHRITEKKFLSKESKENSVSQECLIVTLCVRACARALVFVTGTRASGTLGCLHPSVFPFAPPYVSHAQGIFWVGYSP